MGLQVAQTPESQQMVEEVGVCYSQMAREAVEAQQPGGEIFPTD